MTRTTFDVTCPQCKQNIAVNESQVGTLFTCTDCLEEFLVQPPVRENEPYGNVRPSVGNGEALDSYADAPALPENPAEEFWADDRKQLDVLLNVPAPTTDKGSEAAEPYDFTVACPLCDTRQDVGSEQIGQSVRCPDCHSKYKLHEPHRKRRRPRARGAAFEDAELRLKEIPSAPPPPTQVSDVPVQPASPETRAAAVRKPATRILTPEDAARDTLARAREELAKKEAEQPPLPTGPMTTGVFRFLANPAVPLRIFFISLALWFELELVHAAVSLTSGGVMQQFSSVILRPLALIFGILFVANFATTLLAVMQDSAHGKDEIESLPGVNPTEWFFESWQMFASLFLTWALAGILAQVVYMATGSLATAYLFGLVPTGILLVTVFPVMLLSFLECNAPYSAAIGRGLKSASKHWLIFMLQGTVVVFVGLGLTVVRGRSTSMALNFFACVGIVFVSMLFFRLLGRLTWACQEKLAEEKSVEH